MKRDIKAQSYTDKYLRKLLSMSVDIIIYMQNFKVKEIAEVIYNKEIDDVEYNPLFEFKIEKYENSKAIGKFKTLNKPCGKAKQKIELNKEEIERILA